MTEAPTLTHIIMNAVLICPCPAKVVLVLNVIGGEVECIACKSVWFATGMDYEPTPFGARASVDIKLKSSLVLPGRPS